MLAVPRHRQAAVPDGDIAAALRLTGSKTTRKGVQIPDLRALTYGPAGAAQYGSFALEE
jgi:hypothetical protein